MTVDLAAKKAAEAARVKAWRTANPEKAKEMRPTVREVVA